MSRPVRSFFAALVTSALLFSQVAPALAANSVNAMEEEERSVPVLFDAMILRPIGMLVTGVGAVAFCAVAPLMAITRPTDLGKPFQALVMRPARFTWVDPLGTH